MSCHPDGTHTLIVENVPYCASFDSCAEDEFFPMANSEAGAFLVDEYYNGEYTTGDYNVSIERTERVTKSPNATKAPQSICRRILQRRIHHR